MSETTRPAPEAVEKAALEIWRWCWTRVQNLHTARVPPMAVLADTPPDRPAVAQIEERLTDLWRDAQRTTLIGVRDAFLSASRPGAQYTNVVTELDKLISGLAIRGGTRDR